MGKKTSVLMICMDGVRPELVFNAEKYGINLPNLKQMIENGTSCKDGMYSVFPSLTYVCHASLMTGTNPATHGVVNNEIWAPQNEYKGFWQWFVPDKVMHLLTAAKRGGYLTANVNLPGCIGAEADYNIIEFWNNPYNAEKDWLDHKLIRAMSTPCGIVEEIEKIIGEYPGWERYSEADEKRFKTGMWLLENKIKPECEKAPFFMSQYFVSYDCAAHHDGVFSKEAFENLEKIDFWIGELFKKAEEIAGENLIKCVISDHGFIPIDTNISLNTILYNEGLIKLDAAGNISDWQVISQSAHGSTEVRLKDKSDTTLYEKIFKLLEETQKKEKSGIRKIYTKEQLKKEKTLPDADFALDAENGYKFDNDILGSFHKSSVVDGDYFSTYVGTHGFHPEHKEMNSCFFIEGVGLPVDKEIKNMRLIDAAPTLASLMNINLPDAEGLNILMENKLI